MKRCQVGEGVEYIVTNFLRASCANFVVSLRRTINARCGCHILSSIFPKIRDGGVCVHISCFTLICDIEHGWGVAYGVGQVQLGPRVQYKAEAEIRNMLYFAPCIKSVIVAVQSPYCHDT